MAKIIVDYDKELETQLINMFGYKRIGKRPMIHGLKHLVIIPAEKQFYINVHCRNGYRKTKKLNKDENNLC